MPESNATDRSTPVSPLATPPAEGQERGEGASESGHTTYPGSWGTVADLRERLVVAVEHLEMLRNKAAASHALTEHARLAGKKEGVLLALSYVDEMPRFAGSGS